MSVQNPTSAEQFEEFKALCLKWQDRLGMTEWQLHFTHRDLPGKYAGIEYQIESYLAEITLNTDWDDRPVTTETLESAARHEVAHLVIAELHTLTWRRFVAENQLLAATERSVRAIERLVGLGVAE